MSSPAETEPEAAPDEARTGLEGIFDPDDARAYERFVTWSVGGGFRLAVVEVTAPRDREALLAWTASKVSGVQVVRLDEAEQRTVWSLLEAAWHRPGGASLLALTRLEELQDRARICAQLNLQRDEQARAFAVPWVVVVHPAAALDLQQHAPDFCDFAVLWLREHAAAIQGASPPIPPADLRVDTSASVLDAPSTGSELLDAARKALLLGKLNEAVDLLAEHDLQHPRDRTENSGRLLLEADLLQLRGEPAQALRRLEEALQLGSDSERAPILRRMARIWLFSGAPEKALTMLREAEAMLGGADHRRGTAMILGDIARILVDKGDVDQALSLHEEALKVFDQLGDRRERAIALNDMARVLVDKGDIDQALRLHKEALDVFEQLGDRYSRAVVLGDVARILADKGDVDQALSLLHERLQFMDQLGDQRERAVTLNDIARILASRGDVDQALSLFDEMLQIGEVLGDQAVIAGALRRIAHIDVQQGRAQQAIDRLTRAYTICQGIDHLDGICWVGLDLGQLLCAAGHQDRGLPILERSRAGFEHLGRLDLAAQVAALIDKIRSVPS